MLLGKPYKFRYFLFVIIFLLTYRHLSALPQNLSLEDLFGCITYNYNYNISFLALGQLRITPEIPTETSPFIMAGIRIISTNFTNTSIQISSLKSSIPIYRETSTNYINIGIFKIEHGLSWYFSEPTRSIFYQYNQESLNIDNLYGNIGLESVSISRTAEGHIYFFKSTKEVLSTGFNINLYVVENKLMVGGGLFSSDTSLETLELFFSLYALLDTPNFTFFTEYSGYSMPSKFSKNWNYIRAGIASGYKFFKIGTLLISKGLGDLYLWSPTLIVALVPENLKFQIKIDINFVDVDIRNIMEYKFGDIKGITISISTGL